jgi:hypothetical protein
MSSSTRTTPINTRRSVELILVDVLTDDDKVFELSMAPGVLAIDIMREKGYSYDQFIEVPRGLATINC